MAAMTFQERQVEFDRLFQTIPGTNVERLRRVCDILGYEEITVRIIRARNSKRAVPAKKLRILKRELEREAAETPAATA